MRFNDYFADWLYAEDGYYANYKAIGKDGDFYTSVSTSKFFGGTIANHFVRRIESGELPEDTLIVEVGAHKGYLLADFIQFVYTLKPELLETLRFAIIERFDALQQTQKEYLAQSFGDAVEITHYKDLSELKADNAFIIANEIFDAFPCTLVYKGQEAVVTDHAIEWSDEVEPYTKTIMERYNIEKGEIGLGYEDFAKVMGESFKRCEFVTFDYGDILPRNDFSARVYKRHEVFPLFEADLKSLYKNSDITYDVHFQHLIDAFESQGFTKEKYATQMVALNDFGITELLEILESKVSYDQYLKEVGKVKTLLNPAFLGERFKMVNFVKGWHQG